MFSAKIHESSLDVVRILASIAPTEIYHFAAFHKSLETMPGLIAPGGLQFPDLRRDPELAHAIFPEPCQFLQPDFPLCSVVRPSNTANAGAVVAAALFSVAVDCKEFCRNKLRLCWWREGMSERNAIEDPVAATDPEGTGGECGLEDLMTRYQRTDREAATELVAILSPKLLLFFKRPEATREHAEDLLQECWLRIHKARHSYRPGSPVLPWLFAIARHTRVDGWRRICRTGRLRQVSLEELPVEPRAPRGPGLSAIELKQLLAGLPKNQSDVVYMMKVLGMSLRETARATGSTVAGVKQRAHRAYERLRVLVRAYGCGGCH